MSRCPPARSRSPNLTTPSSKKRYENNKAKFFTPEYRKVAVLLLTPDELKKDVTLTDDEVKAAYTETKETYDKPERRRLQQIAFKDKATAEAARKDILDGKKNFLGCGQGCRAPRKATSISAC